MIGVSVIVCCYNSSNRLSATIEHLANQKVPAGILWEIVIVDNNSTDDTKERAAVEWRKYNSTVSFRVVVEQSPGLSAAREKGIEEALYDYLIFCDDDNWLDCNYVNKVFELLKAHPQVAVVGGNNVAVFETAPPAWISFFQHSYAIGNQGEGTFEILEGNRYIVGAGMAFKKAAYLDIKRKAFNFYLTDRIGNKVVGGGDVELCFIFKLAGYKIAYSAELILQHYMPSVRITKKYLTNMWHQYAPSWLVFEAYKTVLICAGKETITERYWKELARQAIADEVKFLPQYMYSKLRGDVAYYLPHETKFIYNYYLLRNARSIVRMILEIQSKIR
ncbi:glycosyltransferase [Hymenobacter norwichensis]|uniref:glycosyltransferase n=1 Tax=Hymenobacter norwichensis TaxID=223903 RepID=UPI0003B36D2E|nr:glycosyltransferase [Hymenobacter norwichensis]